MLELELLIAVLEKIGLLMLLMSMRMIAMASMVFAVDDDAGG